MKIVLFFTVLFFISFVSAACEPGQIDINIASLGKLDEITGIGPAYAQRIIDARPFDSVDDLIDINGIGPVTLDKIKDQNLACVSGEIADSEGDNEKDDEENDEEQEDNEGGVLPEFDKISETSEENSEGNKETKKESSNSITIQTISLNSESKDIKKDESSESLNSNALWGLIGFSVLLGCLYLLKFAKTRKNEFME
jgi:hypothetical protein